MHILDDYSVHNILTCKTDIGWYNWFNYNIKSFELVLLRHKKGYSEAVKVQTFVKTGSEILILAQGKFKKRPNALGKKCFHTKDSAM